MNVGRRRWTPTRTLVGVLVLVAAILLVSSSADAAVRRYALVVGANVGDAGEVELRYAESDAKRIGKILREMGGFPPENVLFLDGATSDDVRRTLITINSRVRETSGDSMLFVFYSGHADSESLHLRGTRLPMDELKGLVDGSPATARVLVIDACRSGSVTRVKGGKKGPSFAIDVDERLTAKGVAILTSSAAGEDSQESDQLAASFFTHYLASGLIGAADRDGDGQVTLSEAFTYASERTLIATAGTIAGPQHPTYRFDLGGQGDLVLTAPRQRTVGFGELTFPAAGNYIVQRSSGSGPVVAEVAAENGGRRLAVAAGNYHVTRRETDHLLEGRFAVADGGTTPVARERMTPIAYAQVVRKGGTSRTRVVSAYVAAGRRGPVLEFEPAPHRDLGVRVDFKPLSLDLRLTALDVELPERQDVPTVGFEERALSVAAVRSIDLGPSSVGFGLETGVFRMERMHPLLDGTRPEITGFFYGPVLQAEVPVWRRLHVRLDGGLLAHSLKPPRTEEENRFVTTVTYRISAGLGLYF